MALHQYIGARYTPYFYENSLDPTSCEWEANVTYEPLTYVTLPNQHCYLSKKTVPDTIGTPASNPEYWLEVAWRDAYITDLQNQIDIIDGDITRIDGELSNIGVHNYWYIGDSFLNIADGWGYQLNNIYGTTGYETKDGGIGYLTNGNNSGVPIKDLIASDTGVPDNITDVIMVMGCNDVGVSHATADIINSVLNTISAIKAKAPDANIYVVFNATFFAINETARRKEACRWFFYVGNCCNGIDKVYFLKPPYYQLQSLSFTADNVHPNTNGSLYLARSIKNCIAGDPCNLVDTYNFHNIYFQLCREDGICEMFIAGAGSAEPIYNGTAINFVADAYIDIYTTERYPVYPIYNAQMLMDNMRLTFLDSSNAEHTAECQLMFRVDGHVRIKVYGQAINNVVKIYSYGAYGTLFQISNRSPF